MVDAFESVSTWRQEAPAAAAPARRALLEELAADVDALSPRRLRVVVDGLTGAGKTTFGHELAAALRRRGRPTARACLDDFKHPWSHARQHGYDRLSGPGYYRNAHDLEAAVTLLLRPAGPDGSGRVVLCAHDPLTGADHRSTAVDLPAGAVLVVDSVFALRPELDPWWDLRVWLEVDPELALERGVRRDQDREGRQEALRLHRDRYRAAERLYLDEVDPLALADVVVDNDDVDVPRVLRRRRG